MICFGLSEDLWSTWVFDVFVEREALENMSYENLYVEHENIEAHEKIKLEVLGISPGAFQVDVELKLWNIKSLAIVSLGVSYKYILALVLSEELWNCTKF